MKKAIKKIAKKRIVTEKLLRISTKTHARLTRLGNKTETYNDVLNKLCSFYEKNYKDGEE